MDEYPIEEMRFRGCVLADSGRYANWREIALVIESENCPGAMQRIEQDAALCDLLDARCKAARPPA